MTRPPKLDAVMYWISKGAPEVGGHFVFIKEKVTGYTAAPGLAVRNNGHEWSIDHVSTGYRVGGGDTRAEAVRRARKLARIVSWGFRSPEAPRRWPKRIKTAVQKAAWRGTRAAQTK